MKINNVEISILVGRDAPVKLYGHNGRTFICANYGIEYSLKIRNDNLYRVMVVASIDGLSVLDGKPALKDGVGYVVEAYSSIIIRGWRKDNDTVGAFKFTKKKKGYAKEVTGSTENCGVIAAVVFAEKISWGLNTGMVTIEPNWICDKSYTTTAASFNTDGRIGGVANTASYNGTLRSVSCSAGQVSNNVNYCSVQNAASEAKSAPDFSASTSWGTKLADGVTTTSFEKSGSIPLAEFNIYYDIRENLEKVGIDLQPRKQVSYPKAFPQGFATPPAGWHA